MPRCARQISEMNLYHIVVRGNNKKYIFKKESYKRLYLKTIQDQREEGLINVRAWCVMDNHIHLIVEGALNDISVAMKKVNTRFAVLYHLINSSTGHLFENRYNSETIDNIDQLLRTIRYIHLNPVRAQMVKCPEDYRWSSFNIYMSYNNAEIKSIDGIDDIMAEFNCSTSLFNKYHSDDDCNLYLDIADEKRAQQLAIANKLIEEHRIALPTVFDNKEFHIYKIVKSLEDVCKLSNKEISEMIDVPYRKMLRIKRKVESLESNQKGPSPMVRK